MRKYFLILAIAFVGIYLFGCAKKESLDETQMPASMETMGAMTTASPMVAETKPAETKPVAMAAAGSLETMMPQTTGFVKPTVEEIQTALMNAGFYAGAVDGKIGPKTKKAIEEFQKAKGLEADGRVGPKTWSVLSAYLSGNPESAKR